MALQELLRVLLVRHAEPEPPVPGSDHASDNERPLSAAGRRAAEAIAASLSGEPIRAVYSSPYRRAHDTVFPIAAAHQVSVRVLPDLRERRLSPTALLEEPFIDALKRARNDPAFGLPGGETSAEARIRGWRAMERIRVETPSGLAVAGTHGGLISILRWSLGQTFTVEEALTVPMPAVFAFEHDGDVWRVVSRWSSL